MAADDWLGAEARRRVRDAVRAVEQRSSAEVVVTVRARSSAHREIDLAVGAVVALAALLFYVFAPFTFYDDLGALAIVFAFAAGALGSAVIAPLKRAALGRRRRDSVRSAARVAFVDQRIATTAARTGILVFVSLLEREVEVVADTGVAVADMGASWTEAVAALEGALRRSASLDDFAAALDKLGGALAAAMPRAADDDNELSDEVA
jgi:putative membrane protein